MRVEPVIRERCAIWYHHDKNATLMTLGVWTEKREDIGEDAEPVALYHWPTRQGVIAVCDGVGGAGGTIVGLTGDGSRRTGAWTASRAVRLAVEQWFVGRATDHGAQQAAPEAVTDPATPAELPFETGLERIIHSALRQLRGPSRSRLQGTMQRSFPTTLALIVYQSRGTHLPAYRLRARWAGDSRCYLLTAEDGLQQLSTDDSESRDALESIVQDPPMTNKISADSDFRINSLVLEHVDAPCVVLCATDGFFNYLRTPAHFEYLLLHTLGEASSLAHWGTLLAAAAQSYTQDDATLALSALGFQEFDQLRQHFALRRTELRQRYIDPVDSLDPADAETFGHARAGSWKQYRQSYERRMADPVEGAT